MNIDMSWRAIVRAGAGAMLAAAVSLSLLALAGCGRSGAAAAQQAPPAPEVGVARVLTRNVREWDDFNGRVAAVETVDLRPRVSGYVERVAYVEGREVAKGDLLFVIDQRRYRADLAKAQAELARARSEARLAQSQDARAQALLKTHAISRDDADTRNAASSQAAAAVRAAEAAVANAELDLRFTEVRAPIAGRTGRAMVTVGNLAQADTTVLTSLVSLDPMYVYFEGDEQSLLRYQALARNGMRAELHNPVRVALAGEDGYPHAGEVDFVDNRVDAATGTFHARAVIANGDRVFTPGLFARVQLEGTPAFDAMLIDDKAVLTDQDRKYVYVVGADGKAERKDVVTGRFVDGLRVVKAGLERGDKVVVQGVQKIFMPGMPVQAKDVAMDAAHGEPVAMQ